MCTGAFPWSKEYDKICLDRPGTVKTPYFFNTRDWGPWPCVKRMSQETPRNLSHMLISEWLKALKTDQHIKIRPYLRWSKTKEEPRSKKAVLVHARALELLKEARSWSILRHLPILLLPVTPKGDSARGEEARQFHPDLQGASEGLPSPSTPKLQRNSILEHRGWQTLD